MNRRKPRSGGQGLFSWAPASGEVAIGEVLANPLTVACRWPTCRAPAGDRCRRLGIGGRRHTCPPHPCRHDDATALATAAQQAQEPRTEPE